MILESKLIPDLYESDFQKITPELLRKYGIRGLICDIDNTLAPYEEPVPSPAVLAWMEKMKENGIQIAFVSNNNWDRVRLFNRDLQVPAYAKSGKPKTRFLYAALRDMKLSPREAALLGDQLLTDCLAGKRLGMKALIVKPIRDKKTLFFRFKRWLEIPYLKKYHKLHQEMKS